MLALWDRDLVIADSLAAMSPAKKTAIENRLQKEAMESNCEEYLACLFLLLADEERFKTAAEDLRNNYLLRKQEYLANVLAAKRLMTDFDYLNIGKPTSA